MGRFSLGRHFHYECPSVKARLVNAGEHAYTKKPTMAPMAIIRAAHALPWGWEDEGNVSTSRARSTAITTRPIDQHSSAETSGKHRTSINRKVNEINREYCKPNCQQVILCPRQRVSQRIQCTHRLTASLFHPVNIDANHLVNPSSNMAKTQMTVPTIM